MRWSVRFLALAQVAFVLAACSAVPGTTSSTSSSPTSEPSSVAVSAPPPSVEPSASAPGDGVGLPGVGIPPDTYARVVVDNLRVRSKPEVSDGSKKLEPLLQDGVRLLILDGPLLASGYDWYQVKPIFDADTPEGGYPFGWVARAGKDGESWIEPESVICPPIPTDVSSLYPHSLERRTTRSRATAARTSPSRLDLELKSRSRVGSTVNRGAPNLSGWMVARSILRSWPPSTTLARDRAAVGTRGRHDHRAGSLGYP